MDSYLKQSAIIAYSRHTKQKYDEYVDSEKSLEDFMINRFGCVLYEIFFKDYTKNDQSLLEELYNDLSRILSETRHIYSC